MADRSAARRRRFTVDNLFADTRPQAAGVTDLVEAKEIRLDRIRPDPSQPRQTFDEEKLQELAASIRLEGVLQPIVVRYESGRDVYIIVHGERRWRASKLAGQASIPALVREVPIERRLIQQLMENIVRDDLNALDRASALRALKAQLRDAPWEAVAEAVGIRRSRLFQLLGTEKLPAAAQQDIRAGRLSEKQSRALQGLPEPAQEALRDAIISDGLSAERAQQLARSLKGDPVAEDPAAASDLVRRLINLPEMIYQTPKRGIVASNPSAEMEQVTLDAPRRDAETMATIRRAEPVTPGPGADDDWRELLRRLAGEVQPAAGQYDPQQARDAVRTLAAELRTAPADDLRDGALTRDVVVLLRALEGAVAPSGGADAPR